MLLSSSRPVTAVADALSARRGWGKGCVACVVVGLLGTFGVAGRALAPEQWLVPSFVVVGMSAVLVCLAAAARIVASRMPRRGWWAAAAVIIALRMLDGSLQALGLVSGVGESSPVGDWTIVVVGTTVTITALLGRGRLGRADLLDAALLVLAGLFVVWEIGLQPSVDPDFSPASYSILLRASLVLLVASMVLLEGRSTGVNRVHGALAGALILETLAGPMASVPRGSADYAMASVASSVSMVVALMVAAALWWAPNRFTQDEQAPGPTVQWWAPMAVSIGIYMIHAFVRGPISGPGFDAVEATIIALNGIMLVMRIAQVVRQRDELHREGSADRTRLRMLLTDVRDHIVVLGPDLRLRTSQKAFPEGLLPAGATAEMTLIDAIHPDDRDLVRTAIARANANPGQSQSAQVRVRNVDGTISWFEGAIVDRFATEGIGGYVVTFRDITSRRAMELDLQRRVAVDDLTGLPSRAAMRQVVSEAITHASGKRPVTVLYADIDRLKVINDSLGHHVGDEVIRGVARRWAELVPAGATLGRLGADELLICYPHGLGRLPVEALAATLLAALDAPIDSAGHQLTVTASIGMTTITDPGTRVDVAMRDADAAMYRAKSAGRDRAVMFNPDMREAAVARLRLEQNLRVALRNHELAIHLQPVVDLSTGETSAFEALVRWNAPDGTPVRPDVLISLAEETGLIVQLGQEVLEQACDAIRVIRQATGKSLRIAVNTSPIQLVRADFVDAVRSALAKNGLPPSALVIEVTETALLDEEGSGRATLQALHRDGVLISLDDFGTGFSSLSYLGTFPLDQLKLDRSLVSGAVRTATGEAVLNGVLTITESLGLPVVAEGLEDEETARRLHGLGAGYGQGWHYARAMPLPDALAWLGPVDALPGHRE